MQQNIFYDFANPTSQVGDASIGALTARAPGSDTNSYGREHIYELQSSPCGSFSVSRILLKQWFIVAEFINEFEQDDDLKSLWNTAATSDFCTWTASNIYNQPVILNLVACLPYNANRKYMPWLNVRRSWIFIRCSSVLTHVVGPDERHKG